MAVPTNLGIATAYGYAKSKGYTGTEEEFAILMADYASVGQEAKEAKEDAQSAASSAEQDALDAEAWARGTRNNAPVGNTDPAYKKNSKYYAEQTQQAIEDAAEAAIADVMTEITTAHDEAVTAASAATTAKETAVSAKDTAVDAKQAAINANANAQTAANRAEQAASLCGYMFFNIVDGDLIYSRTDNVEVDFYQLDGCLYVTEVET